MSSVTELLLTRYRNLLFTTK